MIAEQHETEGLQQKVAETAYYWKKYGSYGSETKAVRALKRRKGIALETHVARNHLQSAVKLLERANAVCQREANKRKVTSLAYLSADELHKVMSSIQQKLEDEYPTQVISVRTLLSLMTLNFLR